MCAGTFAAVAYAAVPEPTMSFMSVPAIAQSRAGEPGIIQQRNKDAMVIIAKERAQCGQRPSEPTFDLQDGVVHVGYSVPGSVESAAGACVSTAIFTVKNLPQQDLQVAVDTHGAPPASTATARLEPSPQMSFVSVPAISDSISAKPETFKYWRQGELIVVAKERAECGQRPADPAFDLEGGTVHVSYSLPGGAESGCMATAIFTLKNLPGQPTQVVADANRIAAPPVMVAQNTAPARAAEPTMKFMSVPAADEAGGGKAQVLQYRHKDEMVVIYKERADCGQRPAEPGFDVAQGTVHVTYAVPPLTTGSSSDGHACMALGIFTIKNLPNQDFMVAADVTRKATTDLCKHPAGSSRAGVC
jgi:hypothetical protein